MEIWVGIKTGDAQEKKKEKGYAVLISDGLLLDIDGRLWLHRR